MTGNFLLPAGDYRMVSCGCCSYIWSFLTNNKSYVMTSVLRIFFFLLSVFFVVSDAFPQTMMKGGRSSLPASEWKAEWVTDSRAALADDSLLYQDNPAPLFRKEFLVN